MKFIEKFYDVLKWWRDPANELIIYTIKVFGFLIILVCFGWWAALTWLLV